ncbi:MAG: metal-dependent phosphohydrolase [Nocardioidaceae bacterium]|nr:metal-dependent phosphohydrolase [Nocardioidaceae bacterium]
MIVHVALSDDLRTRWLQLLPDAVGLGEALLARWDEPHRRYHNQRHLLEVLQAVDLLAGEASDPTAVRLAAWFHDAVYAGQPDDESRSAVLATTALSEGVEASRVAQVARLVEMTRQHDPAADDRDGCVLNDADLAVLAATPDRYRDYTAAIRQEYAHVPDEGFRPGRAEVVRTLLARPRLFRTRYGYERWEPAARRQLRHELQALTGSR